ncbi:pre-mRNA splicing factor PRP46 [Lodderomyces elongisporus NRRL YB-4239]|uniref:Pre-mRNA-splicing factor PRP46 n=1 Tax=Lodderomyces elongisporus (strain ATCC 11503 / CBS 2605 / JCM 1781 / NBRC 1676 / NRRL YB-4239) TaxID=379508 RepID=A5DY24_LODEL|nr:pre-mRNA splicing factor PRP46 [Lodderomyces elongisporus NRRL YB-4239]
MTTTTFNRISKYPDGNGENGNDDDSLIPPADELSEAMYRNSKLAYLFPTTTNTSTSSTTTTAEIPKPSHITSVSTRVVETAKELAPAASTYHQPQWKLLKTLAGAHQGWIRTVALDEVTNKWFVTGSSDSTIKIWDLATLQMKALLTGHIMGVRTLIVSKRFPYLFSGAEDKTLRCWDLERLNAPEGCQIRNYHGHVGGIYALALHDELDVLLSGGRDSVVRVWDIRTSKEVALLVGHTNDITSIVADVNEPQVITSSMDGTIRLWDLRNQKSLTTITHHSKSIRAMKAHPDEYTFASGDSSGAIKQWLLPKAQLLNNFEFDDDQASRIINTMSINPVTNTLFSGYDDGKMNFYEYTLGKLLQTGYAPNLPGSERAAIYASTFDMSGLRLITCGGDKSIKIWGNADVDVDVDVEVEVSANASVNANANANAADAG